MPQTLYSTVLIRCMHGISTVYVQCLYGACTVYSGICREFCVNHLLCSGSSRAEMRREEETKRVPDKNNTAIVDDGIENKEVNEQSDNKYSKRGICRKYTNYGYTSNRTTTTNMMSVNTNNIVDTNDETEPDDSSDCNTRVIPNNTNNDKDTTSIKLANEIKALSGTKLINDELTTYGDEFGQKEEEMIQISGLITNSIQLDESRSTCLESINLQVDIQGFQEICQDTRNNFILQRFLKDTKKSDRASKLVWGTSKINVGNDYKPDSTAMVAFVKTTRRVIQQGLMN